MCELEPALDGGEWKHTKPCSQPGCIPDDPCSLDNGCVFGEVLNVFPVSTWTVALKQQQSEPLKDLTADCGCEEDLYTDDSLNLLPLGKKAKQPSLANPKKKQPVAKSKQVAKAAKTKPKTSHKPPIASNTKGNKSAKRKLAAADDSSAAESGKRRKQRD